MKPDQATFTQNPRADRFRLGDTWIGPNGRPYRVRKGIGPGLAYLAPIGPDGPCVHIRALSVRGFRRVRWGGNP